MILHNFLMFQAPSHIVRNTGRVINHLLPSKSSRPKFDYWPQTSCKDGHELHVLSQALYLGLHSYIKGVPDNVGHWTGTTQCNCKTLPQQWKVVFLLLVRNIGERKSALWSSNIRTSLTIQHFVNITHVLRPVVSLKWLTNRRNRKPSLRPYGRKVSKAFENQFSI
jgi:hypothetical protein